MWGEIFCTRPNPHPAFYTIGAGSFPGESGGGVVFGHPTLTSAEFKERVERELHFNSPSESSWPVLGLSQPYHNGETFDWAIHVAA
jgi:hypothetical protein